MILIMDIIIDIIKQFSCNHKYMEFNKIERIDKKYVERWLKCKKCLHQKIITIYKYEYDRGE